ncbi:MAG TPA: hypothetical protein VN628_10770 [Vicinamibacterales bacterium]|nr:hypothetical protein [Vicinamibacterales bacterium]
MNKHFLAGALLAVTATAFLSAQQNYKVPRTPWGDPDLSGVYSNDDETGTPMERPAQFEGRRQEDITPAELAKINKDRTEQFDSSVAGTEFAGGLRPPTHLIFDSFERKNSRVWLVTDPPDGKIPPLTPEGQARLRRPQGGVSTNANPVGPFNSYADMGLYDRCITRGIPNSMMPAGYGSNYEIHQGQGYATITYEMIHETRVIPLDGRPHVPGDIHLDLGDPRGHFEGDTLVVETTNFTARSAYRGASENLKMTERFKPLGPNAVDWSVTFDDPHTWTRPWTFTMKLTKKDRSQQVFEYACHEGNYAMPNILSAQRASERAAEGGAVAK